MTLSECVKGYPGPRGPSGLNGTKVNTNYWSYSVLALLLCIESREIKAKWATKAQEDGRCGLIDCLSMSSSYSIDSY